MADDHRRADDDTPTAEYGGVQIGRLGAGVKRADAAIDQPADDRRLTDEHPASQERRAHRRVPYDASVRCVLGHAPPFRCEALNLSAGGMSLQVAEGDDVPPVQSLLEICLMERGDRVLTLEADVVRLVDERTFAVRFVDLDTRRRAFVARLVDIISVLKTGEQPRISALHEALGALADNAEAPTAAAAPEPPPASLEALGGAERVPHIVAGETVDWHGLDYRMVYLLSLITPAQLSYAKIIAQARELAELTDEQAIAFLAELARRGIIES